MMKNIFLTLVFSWLFVNSLTAQIINGTDTLYGNEWIKFDQSYFKLMVAEDGIYRVGYQELTDAGLPVTSIIGSEYQLFHNGEEVPIYTSTSNIFSPTDYLEFYGQKNRSELDQYLFQNPDEEMMNPLYSLFTDTSAYFLTWTNVGTPLRYEEVGNDLTNLPAKEPYYLEEHVAEYHSSWDKEKNGQGVSVSNFTMAEGYSSNYANIQSFNLVPTFPYISGPGSKLHIRYAGNLKQHSQQISLNGQILTTDNYYGYAVRKLDFDIDNSLLNGTMELKFQGLTDNNDRQRISNIILTYPRTFNFNNSTSFLFNIKSAGINKYLEIENFNAGNSPILYDLTNNKRQIALPENGLVKINLLPSQNNRTLSLINSEEGVKKVNAIEPIDFINYEGIDANFIFLSNPKLYDDGNGNNYVQEYADYRSSQIGGGYKTIIVDVQQIFDQFGWGINRHSLSIRNFAHYVKKEWEEVQYFFVVGKGREYPGIRTSAQLAAAGSFYVPTFGYPGADNLLISAGLKSMPLIPLGRLAVSTPNEIKLFLKKMMDFESNINNEQTIEGQQWKKNIIHLGGGGLASEQSLIKNYLANMENIIEDNLFGAEVSSFYKTSSDPIQVSKSEQIFERINNGVSIITFFGHAAVGTFDFNIDNPDNYNNYGKYPVLFSLGCYSGNIHTNGLGISERFVFQEIKQLWVWLPLPDRVIFLPYIS
ncbi:MAG: C25 family cysteine peptidase [Saprospiraceae bacterium]